MTLMTYSRRKTFAFGCCALLIALTIAFTPEDAFGQPPPDPNVPTAPSSQATAPPVQQPPPEGTPPPVGTTPPKEPEKKWYDVLNIGAFADAYYAHNWNAPRPNGGTNLYHPYTANQGFSLSWVGLDLGVEPEPVGATLQLRFGPSVPNLALGDFAIPGGVGFVQNGYVSWKPGGKDGKVTLILGKFDTIYGAEVAQSHLNINYTRGFLYNLAQPFFHTGLRADIQLISMLQLKLLAVNGWNNTIDNNHGKSFGAQLTLTPVEQVGLSLGWMGGPEESEMTTVPAVPATATTPEIPAQTVRNIGANGRVRHLVDLVADLKPTKDLRFVVNGDYVTQAVVNPTGPGDNTASWFGAAALARYQFTQMFAAGLRGEVIRDKDAQVTAPNTVPVTIYTGTLTLELAPHKMLLIRLDNRVDAADEPVFPTLTLGNTAKTQITSVLGVVAKTN